MLVEMLALPASSKPCLRGVSHRWACLCSVPLSVALVVAAGSERARVAVTVYAVSLVALFGVSALYHRVNWRSLAACRWMRRLDHSMIFMLIAGTYTPFAVLALRGPLGTATLVGVWAGALAGVVCKLVWIDAPTWQFAVAYIARHQLKIGTFGHAGDGNLHPTAVLDAADEGAVDRAHAAFAEIFVRAIDLDGTITGEHGIGISKLRFLERQLGADHVALLRRIKTAFDPNGILNPGKLGS
jgi:FAD/FMN-containing dehydrogenase